MGDTGATGASKLKCALQIWHTRLNKDGEVVKTVVDETAPEEEEETYALLVNRKFDERGRLELSTLTVNSPYILTTLKAVISKYPSIAGDFSSAVNIVSPYQPLIHNWDELHAYAESIEDDVARMHTNLLLDFLETEIGAEKRRAFAQHERGFCEFASCWMVFRPETYVVTAVKSHVWILKIVKTAYEESMSMGKFLQVDCTYLDHNGVDAGYSKQSFRIAQKEFFAQNNPCKISELITCPRQYSLQGPELEEQLYQRGLKFLELNKISSVRDYDGQAQYLKEPPPSYFSPDSDEDPGVWQTFTELGKVVIDRKTYGEEHVTASIVIHTVLEREDIISTPPFVYGYSCSRKDWCRFNLPQVVDAKWKPDPLQDLVLPEAQKMLVQALVSSHEFPDNSRDQTEQKGKGLVCLLHGPPGAGKTLTAETASHLTQKALFSCTMSELNEYDSTYWFERKLARVLRLATTWKAIILLDEADVFLEARQDGGSDNTKRNALVAVFLKHLEYFSGIIFLTTNRIHVFDAAMKSRVHLALGYTSPDRESRRKIWVQQLKKLPQGVFTGDLDEMLDAVQDHKLNGREIANSILTASTLARFEKQPLQMKHIDTVLTVRMDFETSLERTRRMTVSSDSTKHTSSFPMRQNSILSEEPEDI